MSNSVRVFETGVIHGRFQILHHDHMKYLLAGKARCSHLVIGITNPDPILTLEDPANPERSSPTENPLTYFERYLLLNAAMTEAGIPREEFSIVPFPINFPELYGYYVPLDAAFFVTIYDTWGKRKVELLQARGLHVEVMWERPPEHKGISASLVRKLMIADEPWEHLVPPSVAILLKKWEVPKRLRK